MSMELTHDVGQMTAPDILRHCPGVHQICAEPPCQDMSALGLQLGLKGSRSGIIVHLAEVLVDL